MFAKKGLKKGPQLGACLSLKHALCISKSRPGDLTKGSASMFARSIGHPERLLGISQEARVVFVGAGVSTRVLKRARDSTNIQKSQIKN